MKDTIDKMFDGSLESISIDNTLDLVKYKDRESTFVDLSKKVRYGGTIELAGIELSDIVRAIQQKDINEKIFNDIMFADGTQSVDSFESCKEMIIKNGFTIINGRRNKYMYYIKAKRND